MTVMHRLFSLQHFTLIGATTRAGQLTTPLRDRFGIVLKLELYTPEELAPIVRRNAGILEMDITDDAVWAEYCSTLEEYGLKVIRILNRDVNRNFEGVCAYIDLMVKERLPYIKGAGSRKADWGIQR